MNITPIEHVDSNSLVVANEEKEKVIAKKLSSRKKSWSYKMKMPRLARKWTLYDHT